MAWNPPLEDPQDKNPIVRSQWLLVEDVVRGRSALGRDRVVFLEKAVELLRAGGNFIAAAPGSASASALAHATPANVIASASEHDASCAWREAFRGGDG